MHTSCCIEITLNNCEAKDTKAQIATDAVASVCECMCQ